MPGGAFGCVFLLSPGPPANHLFRTVLAPGTHPFSRQEELESWPRLISEDLGQ